MEKKDKGKGRVKGMVGMFTPASCTGEHFRKLKSGWHIRSSSFIPKFNNWTLQIRWCQHW